MGSIPSGERMFDVTLWLIAVHQNNLCPNRWNGGESSKLVCVGSIPTWGAKQSRIWGIQQEVYETF